MNDSQAFEAMTIIQHSSAAFEKMCAGQDGQPDMERATEMVAACRDQAELRYLALIASAASAWLAHYLAEARGVTASAVLEELEVSYLTLLSGDDPPDDVPP
jgi:hypothetical protein